MRTVTAAVIGAGLRGAEAYASYALAYPHELTITAVAEPNAERRERFAGAHRLLKENVFDTWEALLARERLADCVFVCTQDRMHFQPVMRALDLGYHVLCEKPMSPDPGEILQMTEKAEKTGRMLSICHVLRYSPFFAEVKRLLDAGAIGRLINIQHAENVGYFHAAHSFVRGNWRNDRETSPMILQKCCHDMDILRYLAGAPCREIASFGSLTWFRPENAPKGAPARCLDGCPHRETCPYYAPRFYLSPQSRGFVSAVAAEEAQLLDRLADGPYGRCVYRCDNNVVDHQVVSMRFDNDVTATLTMCDFTQECKRVITLMGSHGQIEGDMEAGRIRVSDFATGISRTTQIPRVEGGHSGSDENMMRAFVRLIASDGAEACLTGAREACQSHFMAFAAEEARISGKVVSL